MRHILKRQPPDLILSGINHGSNLADDVTYSGTVAGAMEGALLGIRSIALSLMMGFEDGERRALWDTPLAHAPSAHQEIDRRKWDPNTLINVNFPDAPPEDVKGVAVATQGVRDQALLDIDSRTDPWGTPYFWFGFERRKSTLVPGTDLAAIAENKISVTPLSLDLTDRSRRQNVGVAPRLSFTRRGMQRLQKPPESRNLFANKAQFSPNELIMRRRARLSS